MGGKCRNTLLPPGFWRNSLARRIQQRKPGPIGCVARAEERSCSIFSEKDMK
jgi:hypothetical protein